jgi:hypothetical protein
MKVDEVSCAQEKSQHSTNVAACDIRKSRVAVCDTECAPQDSGTHQENLSGIKENTIRESGTLVSEGNLLKLRDVSGNSVLNNSTLQPNTEGKRTYQELQIRLTRCDSLVRLSRSSGSESHLNITSGEGTEPELNMPACPDSGQEMLDADKVNEKQSGRNHVSHGGQTVLSKGGNINAKSVGGENGGEMVSYLIHESLLDKSEEVERISSRHVLKGCSAVEKLSCDTSQDKEISGKASSELNLGESSDKQSLLKNCHSNHKVTELQFNDKNALTKSRSQISCCDGRESDGDSSNGEDIAPGRNGHNILKLKHNIGEHRNGDGQLSEKVGSEGEEINEECIETHINLNVMQLCKENENDRGRVSTDGSDVPVPDRCKIYRENVAHLNIPNSIEDILNDSVCMLKDNEFEILEIPEFVPLRADVNQQVWGTGDAEPGNKETPRARVLSPNSRTSDDTYHDVLFAQPDSTVSNSRVSHLPSEKKIPSVRQNGRTQLAEKDAIGFLPTRSGKKSGENQTQVTVQNGPGVGQTAETRHSNKSSLTSGRSNPYRKLSSSVQVTESDERLSRADSSSCKCGMNAIIKKCKQTEDCINSTHAKENIVNDLLSQRGATTIDSCPAVNMLGQTDVPNTALHFSSRNSSVVSYMAGSCDQVPENITANTGQHSSEESSFSYPSRELASPPSSLPPPEASRCSQRKGNFLLKFFKDVDPDHLFNFLCQCIFRTMCALFIYPFIVK